MSDAQAVSQLFEAISAGDVAVVKALLAKDPSLVGAERPHPQYRGWTPLHSAAQGGHLEIVKSLLALGADPNARESGDNTYPLHWAAAAKHADVMRALVDAGGDVHGVGDLHGQDVIGWATFQNPRDPTQVIDVTPILLERGARHHIFSAISVGDLNLVRQVVKDDPRALDRRMSQFEQGMTPLHHAMSRHRYDIVDLLIELGADVEATDLSGQSPMAVAMLRGDLEAMRRLHAAGAKEAAAIPPANFTEDMGKLAASVRKGIPMINVPDVAETLDWYVSIGFKELGRYGEDGKINWGMLSFGGAELMLSVNGTRGRHDVGLWFYTDRVDELYQLLKARQLDAARAALSGRPGHHQLIEFEEDIYNPFYGGRQFSIRDLNGYSVLFYQD